MAEVSDQPAGDAAVPAAELLAAQWEVLPGIDPDTAEFPAQAHVAGERILVLRVGAGFRGVERSCPHQQKSLHDAFLQGGEKMIRCRWHNYVFRLSDGKAVNCPGFKLRVFDVKREGGVLMARAAS